MGNMAFLYGSGEVNITEIANYQRKSGSVTLGKNETTINCGFTPDVIFFTLKEKITFDNKSMEICTGCIFPELSNTSNYYCTAISANYTYLYEFWGSKATNGFTAAYTRYAFSDASSSSMSKSFDYVAIKYTE